MDMSLPIVNSDNPTKTLQALVPLAALAIQSAQEIPGLLCILEKYGWDGAQFSTHMTLDDLRGDLWKLFEINKNKQLYNALCFPTSGKSKRIECPPIESFKNHLAYLQTEMDRLPPGRLVNELTHYAQCTIIDLQKSGKTHDAEYFKHVLQKFGWSPSMFAFMNVPDIDALVHYTL